MKKVADGARFAQSRQAMGSRTWSFPTCGSRKPPRDTSEMQVPRPPLGDAWPVSGAGLGSICTRLTLRAPLADRYGVPEAPPSNAACAATRLHTGWDFTPDVRVSFSKYVLHKRLFISQTEKIPGCSESLGTSCRNGSGLRRETHGTVCP